jgi:hypothetical protein
MTRGKGDDKYDSLVTIAPFDWKVQYGTGKNLSNATANYLKLVRLSVMGSIQAWGGNVNSINYTLSHHCETDEDRDWDALKGRLLSWTGEPGGNNHGVQILDWKHGIMNHALSTVALSTVQEDPNYAGIC